MTASWRQTDGPGTVTFDAPGTYTVELRGSDSVFERSAQVRVVVAP